jgi:hypothetical protein
MASARTASRDYAQVRPHRRPRRRPGSPPRTRSARRLPRRIPLTTFGSQSTTVRSRGTTHTDHQPAALPSPRKLDPTWDPPARLLRPRPKPWLRSPPTRPGGQRGVARLARQLLQRCVCLTQEIKALNVEIAEQVNQIAPALLEICGCGPLPAAKSLVRPADVRRFRSKDAFARYNGTAPLPVGSSNH